MSCSNLKPPSPPTLVNLPEGIKPAKGSTLDNIKSLGSGKGLNNAMNNVGDLVSTNIKEVGAALSPSAIAGKVGELIEGVANTITSTVQGVVDGITGLKGQLKSLNPKSKLSEADKLKSQVAGKSNGLAEMAEAQARAAANDCDKQYISQASDVNKGMTDTATQAVSNVSRKDRAKMVRDPEFKQQKTQEIEQQVKDQTQSKITTQAQSTDKELVNLQSMTQSSTLETARCNK